MCARGRCPLQRVLKHGSCSDGDSPLAPQSNEHNPRPPDAGLNLHNKEVRALGEGGGVEVRAEAGARRASRPIKHLKLPVNLSCGGARIS